MNAFLDAVLFLALIGAGIAIARWCYRRYTTRGLRARQEHNAENIAAEVQRTCPLHGVQQPHAIVRSTGVERCPECFRKLMQRNPNFSNQ